MCLSKVYTKRLKTLELLQKSIAKRTTSFYLVSVNPARREISLKISHDIDEISLKMSCVINEISMRIFCVIGEESMKISRAISEISLRISYVIGKISTYPRVDKNESIAKCILHRLEMLVYCHFESIILQFKN